MLKKHTLLSVLLCILTLCCLLSSCSAQQTTEPCTELDLSGTEALPGNLAEAYPDLETLTVRGVSVSSAAPLAACSTLKQLDARDTGLTVEQYTELSAALPECEILWSVPIAGETFDSDTVTLTLPDCGGAELDRLKYFPLLKEIDATACTDDAAVFAAENAMTGVSFTRTVDIFGTRYAPDVEALDFTGQDLSDPSEAACLGYLKGPVTVDMTGPVRTLEEMNSWQDAYPNVTFLFSFTLEELGCADLSVDGNAETLDLSDRSLEPQSLEVLRNYLKFLPAVSSLNMMGCGIDNETMDAFRAEYPESGIYWAVYLPGYTISTDVVAFSTLGVHARKVTSEDCEIFRYCHNLVALDLGHHYITDLSWLEYVPNLHVLILACCELTDITPIGSLTELRYLELFANENIESYAPLSGLTHLHHLNISYNHAQDFEAFYSLTGLERLWMNRCHPSSAALAELRAQLPDCTVTCFATRAATACSWRVGEVYQAIYSQFRNDYCDPIFYKE